MFFASTIANFEARSFTAGSVFVLSLCFYGCGADVGDVSVGPLDAQDSTAPRPNKPLPATKGARLPSSQPRSPIPQEAEGSWFRDITSSTGVSFSYRNGSQDGFYQLLESVGGGVFSLDFDADGWQDLYFSGGGSLQRHADEIAVAGRSGALFRNERGHGFQNLTTGSGLVDNELYSHGGTVADLNADGFDDVIVAGFRGLQVWLNCGDGTFVEQSESLKLTSSKWNVSAAAVDYDLDGFLDLYLLTYADWHPDPNRRCLNDQKLRDICGPTLFEGQRDILFNSTGVDFGDATDTAGLIPKNRGLGIVAADVDGDGFPDFLVVNDVQENQLYLNQAGDSFQEDALIWGMAYSNTGEREGSMGIDFGDFDHDGFPDLWYTNYTQQDNSLLRSNNGVGFVHFADIAGLGGVSRPWVGFGTGFADFDCDGWDDLYVINGHVAYERRDSPYFQPPQLLRNDNGKTFTDVSAQGGTYFGGAYSGRGAVHTDLDNDGALDLVVVHQDDPVAVLQNTHSSRWWVSVELVGTVSERTAIGAVVEVQETGRTLKKWKAGGGGYLSHSDSRLLFPLTSDVPVNVIVTWPGGHLETFSILSVGKFYTLIEGRGTHVDR